MPETISSTNTAKKYTDIIGLVSGFLATSAALWCLLDPCWKTTSQDLTIQPYDICYGIWVGCVLPSDGTWVCDGYYGKTIIDQHVGGRQHFCRAATICSVIFMSIAILIGGVGSDCCKIYGLRVELKFRFRCFASWLFLLGGTCVLTAGSWYLIEIYYERIDFYRSQAGGLGYTMGRAIYVALASGLLGLLAALCLVLFSHNCCFASGEEHTNNLSSADKRLEKVKPGHVASYYDKRHCAVQQITEYV